MATLEALVGRGVTRVSRDRWYPGCYAALPTTAADGMRFAAPVQLVHPDHGSWLVTLSMLPRDGMWTEYTGPELSMRRVHPAATAPQTFPGVTAPRPVQAAKPGLSRGVERGGVPDQAPEPDVRATPRRYRPARRRGEVNGGGT